MFKESCRLIHAGWVLIFCSFSLAVFKGKRKTLNKRVTYNMQILLVIWDICRVWSIFYSGFNYYGFVSHESKPLLSITLRALFFFLSTQISDFIGSLSRLLKVNDSIFMQLKPQGPFIHGVWKIKISSAIEIILQIVVVLSRSHVWLFATSWTVAPLVTWTVGSSVHGASQARILEWVAISFSRGFSWPRDQTRVSCIGRWILYHWATRAAPVV